MRVLMISDHADPLAEPGSKETGGQNIYVLYLAKFLARQGVFVDIYTRWDRRNKKEIVRLNNHVRVIRIKAGPKKYMPRDTFLEVVDEFKANVLKRIEREEIEYDLVHTNYWYSGLIGLGLARQIKKPVVHVYHSIGKIRMDALKHFKAQSSDYVFFQKRISAEKQIAKEVDGIISTSPVEKQIIRRLFKVKGEKIQFIPIGIDTNIFKPSAANKKRLGATSSNGNEHTVLYVGRIEWRKGIETLLYAFSNVLKSYPDAHLQIIGGGRTKAAQKLDADECKRLMAIADQLNIEEKVSFLGARRQKNLSRYYNMADVCVVPSYYEPFGIVPLESMACGTPVIASSTGGLRYTVQDGVIGYLVEPQNYNELARRIKDVLRNGKGSFFSSCLERVKKHFQWEIIAQEYVQYFQKIIEK